MSGGVGQEMEVRFFLFFLEHNFSRKGNFLHFLLTIHRFMLLFIFPFIAFVLIIIIVVVVVVVYSVN